MTETFGWLTERIHNKKHFTARYVAHVSELSGMQPSTVANFVGGFCFVILTFSDQAHFLANFLLVAVPLLLIFAYPEEKPADESFFLYFSVFGGVTVFDRSLESIPCYYLLKVIGFLLFCLQPFDINQSTSSIRRVVSQRNELESKKSLINSNKSSTRTALSGPTSQNSLKSPKSSPALKSPSSRPKSSEVKVTVIEEYYQEEELLSPNGTLIQRIVSGPFRKESVRTESNRSVKSPTG